MTISDNILRQTVHIHHASVHQAVKMVAALLRVARVTAGLVENNGSLPPGLWLMSTEGWLPRTGISSGTLGSFRLFYYTANAITSYTNEAQYKWPKCNNILYKWPKLKQYTVQYTTYCYTCATQITKTCACCFIYLNIIHKNNKHTLQFVLNGSCK